MYSNNLSHSCTTSHVQTPPPSNSIPIPTFCIPSFHHTLPPQDPPAADRALLASHNHREAEKRRRERIKSHLDRLRSILACDSKIDKASLLAKAVERVRDLKQRTAAIAEAAQLFPTETDEIVVLPSTKSYAGQRPSSAVFEASVCCDDRSDLLPELIETLRSLRLKTLRAEIATLGGRVRNVLVVARDNANNNNNNNNNNNEDGDGDGDGDLLREALKTLVHRAGTPADRIKRRRVVRTEELS